MLAELIFGSSILYVGTKASKLSRREKQQSLIEILLVDQTEDPHISANVSSLEMIKAAVQNFHQEHIASTFADLRDEQLQEFSSSDTNSVQTDQAPQGLALYANELTIAGMALGFAVIGFAVPICSLLSIPFLLYEVVLVVRNAGRRLIQERKVTIETLVMTTIISGLLLGTSFLFSGSMLTLFLVNLNIFLIVWSRELIAKIRHNSKINLVDIFKQQPDFAWLVKDGIEIETSVEELEAGDVIVVHAGEAIPIDGRVVKGLASIDQRVLTGESQPAEKGEDDQVFALTIVMSGKIYISIERTGEETTAAQIGQILNQTINFKTDAQLWVEDISNKSVLPTLAIFGLLIPIIGPQSAWAILIAHPKYKTTVATYLGVLSYLNRASQNGLLIKDGLVLEQLNEVDTVVFDKTGTLTEEQPHVGQIYVVRGYTEEQVLTYAAAAEHRQTHPIASAILQEAESRGIDIPDIQEAAYKMGYGLTVMVDGKLIRLGSIRFIQEENFTIPTEITEAQYLCHEQGDSLVLVTVDDEIAGAITLKPTIRPEVREVLSGLRERGIQSMYIISGDHETPTRMLANELGIDHYFAETLPENKADLIDELQISGKTVCYVGDGINDAIALKKAAVSISLRGASTVATDTAQAILLDGNLAKLCTLFDLAQEFEKNMKQTFTAVLIPHLLALSGILFLHFGLASAIILTQLGLAAGVVNALLPRLQQGDETKFQIEAKQNQVLAKKKV